MESTFFDQCLGRLKSALDVKEDQAVAEALGMKKAAFSARKKRHSFPTKELRALAQRRPDLHIDVDYVLTGGTPDAAVAAATTQLAEQNGPFKVPMALSQDERDLVIHYRKCSDRARAALLQMAEEAAK